MGDQVQAMVRVRFQWTVAVSGLQREWVCGQGEKDGLINAISMFAAIVDVCCLFVCLLLLMLLFS